MTTDRHHHWRCPACGWRYDSPIPVMAVTCGQHKGAGRPMKPITEEDE